MDSVRRAALALLVAAACTRPDAPARASLTPTQEAERRDSIARARQDSINRTLPGYVVDSILPVDEAIRRFRARVGGAPVTALAQGSPSREALVQRFMQALAATDTAAFRAMQVDAREFIDLYYPESPYTRPPYRMEPDLVWRTIQNPSESGFRRLVRRAAGMPVTLVGHACEERPTVHGRNRLWQQCRLRLRDRQGREETHRLFGSILEREGRFKLLSYRNEF